MRWDVVLFDLDGTLTDSGPGIMHAARYALQTLGVDDVSPQALRHFVGPPLVESFADYFPPALVETAIFHFREYYRQTGWLENAPYPGVADCLASLRAAGAKLYVATSKLERMACQVLEHFSLLSCFDGVCGGLDGDPEAGKKVNVVRRALHLADCTDLSRAVLCGDRCYDMTGGAQAGIATVGVLYGYGSREELLQAGAVQLADSPHALAQLLLHDVGDRS